MDYGAAVGMRSGVSTEEMSALEGDHVNDSLFTELETNVIWLAEQLTTTPAHVPDDLYEALSRDLSPAEMVELAETIATENHRARFNRAFDIGSQRYCEVRR